jgi:hypothetical protein
MQQLSAPLAGKLDGPLAQLCNGDRGVSPSERIPVLVRYADGEVDAIERQVKKLGGRVRHHLRIVNAIAAWIPLSKIEPLAAQENVSFVELEQSFTTA